MNEHAVRPGSVAAAAVLIGGLLVIVLPQHAGSIIRLVIVSAAAAAGLYALTLHAPAAWWASPLDRKPLRRGRRPADEVAVIRASLSGRRQRIAYGPPLPPETVRLLQPLIRGALERAGHDDPGEEGVESARRPLSPTAAAVLAAEPLSHPPWFRTVRPDARTTAAAVHRILDELDALAALGTSSASTNTPAPRERHEHVAHT